VPLGLTVHSLPVVDEAAVAARKSQFGPRLKVLLVMLVCAAPVIASYFTYYVIRPEGRRNFGQLIDPQRPLPDITVKRPEGGEPLALKDLKGQWLLVSVASGHCDAVCEKHLYLQRQLLTSLGKDRDRFDWIWFVTDDEPIKPSLLPALKEALILKVPQAQLDAWLQAEAGHQLRDHLYVVDPLGNWMMRFPAKLDTTGAVSAKRDLERLARASASWDEPGRTKAK
jgi:hypothetical protein